ncbi:hypothetical protein [Roseofilum casamattae]|uniref:Sulfotransferase family protein n=1 Tax=Roseofilum casamattae BLCC-M143 TaxID=3022442 RepID=A0ABT7C1J6_9CYAN|nr:hypothetical protein [Roseofilum casamattae]MDJ1185325.1 sulfotransferase family protein [Roseofilum casamattae BLCC-M143]
MPSLKSFVANTKAKVKQKYYNYRIDSDPNPYQIALRSQPYKAIFILGHMRSASSLLVHILNSNPEIVGYGESHIRYSSEQQLNKLLHKVYSRVGTLRMNHTYILDKLLHNSKLLDETILNSANIYKIFLIRDPESTLPSILKIKPHWSQEKAIDHYISRLSYLERYAEIVNDKERSLFITHKHFFEETQNVFESMQTLLGVQQPFSEEYQVLGTTGNRGVGDSSANIKQGVIVRKAKKTSEVSSVEWTKPCRESYDRCCATLSKYCSTI